MRRLLCRALLLSCWIAFWTVGGPSVNSALAEDWPMWRGDPARSASSAERLPSDLQLAWSREFPPNHVAWAEDPRLQFDASLEPIVAGKTMIVASSTTDSLTALDTETGELRWRFFADGPIRLAPLAAEGRVYFGADDGCFYCVALESGQLVWKLNVAATARRVIGNDRLISVWPVRGGAVLGNGKLYFTAGVWPFEGTMLCAVDLKSGPGAPSHTVTTLENVVPQGQLVLLGDRLFIPGGRAKATCVDLKTGGRIGLAYDSRGLTDFHVAGAGELLFHGAKVYHTGVQRMLPFDAPRPASDGRWVYCPAAAKGEDKKTLVHSLRAYDLAQRTTYTEKDRRGKDVERDRVPLAWELPADAVAESAEPLEVQMLCGGRLYCNRGGDVAAIETPAEGGRPQVVWTAKVDGQPSSMLAADQKLFIVTSDGVVHCFSSGKQTPRLHVRAPVALPPASPAIQSLAAAALEQTPDPAGYCLALGAGDGQWIEELTRQSQLRIIALDPRAEAVRKLRDRWDAAGLYGSRVAAIVGEPSETPAPPYLASLIVCEDPAASGLATPLGAARIFNSLRPYGGVLAIRDDSSELQQSLRKLQLPGAKVTAGGGLTFVAREGALPGAADWTHEYGDAANSLTSADELVKAPLGVLWFGGPASSGELFFNRHYWGPGTTVVDGRMFVQGPQRLAAIDIYTGRVLWKLKLRDGGGPGRQGNFFEVKQPGFHFLAVSDSVYLIYPEVCLRLDPKTGATLGEFKTPADGEQWGKIRVWKDLLIATVFREQEERGLQPSAITALDRHTGEVAWSRDASYSAPLVAVGGDQVYFFDGYLSGLYDAWKRKGRVPEADPARYLKALDARTGKPVWERTTSRIVTWLGYSQGQDILVVSNKRGVDALRGKNGDELWQKNEEAPGFGGHPENVWDKVILSGDLVIDQRGPGLAYDILTGQPAQQTHPITGESVPWQFTKTGHHCNYAIASPHLLTFRADSAGFFDRNTNATGRLPGFRSGCRNSLIPAGGVLSAPNYAHGCVCSYNVFTSLALLHVPEADLWTYNAYKAPKAPAERLGVNFGAPGDRQSDAGTLWMEYPRASDPSASVTVEVRGKSLRWFRNPSSQIAGGDLNWVAASGVEGLSDVKIELPGDAAPRNYTVRLLFAEPDKKQPGERVFDISLQGKPALKALDLVKEAGGAHRLLAREFTGVAAEGDILLSFSPAKGAAILCGVEVVAEEER